MKLKTFFLTLLALPFGTMATDIQQNMVRFSVEAEQELYADIVQVSLYTHGENKSLKELNKQMVERVNPLLSELKKQSAIVLKSNNGYTQVRYNKNGKADGWTMRNEIVLQSKDFDTLSQFVHDFSDQFAIENLESIISVEKLEQARTEVTQAALQKYQQQALLIQQSLQAKGYKLVELSILDHHDPLGTESHVVMYETRKSGTPLMLQGGKHKVKGVVGAQIQLIND